MNRAVCKMKKMWKYAAVVLVCVLTLGACGNLDSKNSQEIMNLLRESNEKFHQTLIMITHDENIALQADRIIAIEDGKIVRDEVNRA